ncbi:hypothetical protein VCH24_61040 [Variovorax boronicumulans]|nr:hypothetical protein VCH24_61040 [Variovorax boronicumulans]
MACVVSLGGLEKEPAFSHKVDGMLSLLLVVASLSEKLEIGICVLPTECQRNDVVEVVVPTERK